MCGSRSRCVARSGRRISYTRISCTRMCTERSGPDDSCRRSTTTTRSAPVLSATSSARSPGAQRRSLRSRARWRASRSRRVGLPAEKVEVVHYGLDDLPAPWGTNEPDPVEADAQVLLAISRLEPQKGLDVAVRALPRIRASHPKAVLVVLGEGPQRAELSALARELEVPVYLLGRVPDVATWLRRAELLVHPARWEGFGLALLEAMLASKPVVATNVSSIPEIVSDGETGLLVGPDDPDALAESGEPRTRRTRRVRRARARTRQNGVQRREDDEPDPRYLRDRSGRDRSSGLTQLHVTRRRAPESVSRGMSSRKFGRASARHVPGTVPGTCQVRAASAPS